MIKYLVLFTPEAIDEGDQFEGKITKMLFGYPDETSGWVFDSVQAAHKEAADNEFVYERDYIVVRVVATKPKVDKRV